MSDKNDLVPAQIFSASITVKPLTTTTYTLTESSSNGCVHTYIVIINIAAGYPSTEFATCKNNPTVIGPVQSPGSMYTWTSDKSDLTPDQINNASITVSPFKKTIYTLTETTGMGCVFVSTVKIDVRSDIICFRVRKDTYFIPNNYLIIFLFVICGIIIGIRYIRIHGTGGPKDPRTGPADSPKGINE